jgi:hypothetical protein
MSDKQEKTYSPQEVAAKVLKKCLDVYKNSNLYKSENSAHEIEEGQEANNDDAECPEQLQAGDVCKEDSSDSKDKKKKEQPEHEEDMSEEENKEHDAMENDQDEQDADKIEADEEPEQKEADEEHEDKEKKKFEKSEMPLYKFIKNMELRKAKK